MNRLFLFAFLTFVSASVINNEINKCNLNSELIEEIQNYQPIVNKIIEEVINGQFQNSTYDYLAEFVDKFGSRLSGTQNLEDSIDYILEKMKGLGLENVHGEPAPVPYWIRGNESLEMILPRRQSLRMLGLGLSVGTPPEGIRASVIVVNSFDELKKLGKKAQNKIVVFNPPWVSYGTTVAYRSRGASEAAKVGAVAALVRSVTPFSLDTVHTGMQSYEDGVNKIPVACITPADANMLERISKRGQQIVLELKMDARVMGKRLSRNSVAELKGKEWGDKVVVVSGHLDSWDVGQGAMDDGAGAFISWNALNILNKLDLRPRRTLRAILWTGEEMGYAGAQYYVNKHLQDIKNLNFVMESDIGTFKPLGLDVSGTKEAQCLVQEVLSLLSPINATGMRRAEDVGSDVSIWTELGVPGGSLWNENEKYFWYHHTAADTMDIEDPYTLDLCTAVWTAVSYVISDLSNDIPKKLT